MESNFSVLDWCIVSAYLILTVGIGFYVNRYVRGMSDFLVAGRSLRTKLGVATMIGSELGLVTAMYAAQKGFTGGFAAFHIGVLALVAALVVGFTGMIVVPLREARVMTIPEYYEKRFRSKNLRIFGGTLLALAGILNMGLFLKAGAIFVTGLTGMSDPTTIKLVMTAMIIMVLAYTTLGGMISVIITDYIQFVVLSVGLLVAVGLSVYTVGWSNIVDAVEQVHAGPGFNPLDGEGFGPAYVTWMLFLGLISCNVWQTAVMRACAAESVAVVKKLYLWSSIGFMIRFIIPQFLGICALAYCVQHPEFGAQFLGGDGMPLEGESLKAMPAYLSQLLPIGLIGLVGAGMLAAFMSTHDTYLLCWSSVLVEDVVAPVYGNRLSQKTRILLTRILLFVIAAFLLVWSMWYELGQDLWDYMAISGSVYFIGAFTVLSLGIYWKGASRTGAWLGLSAGLLALLGLAPVQELMGLTEYFEANSWESHHVGLLACAISLMLMLFGSITFPDSLEPAEDSQ